MLFRHLVDQFTVNSCHIHFLFESQAQ
jgi:hypothetical protein